VSAGKQYPLSFVIKAVDKATGTVDVVFAKLKTFNQQTEKLGNSVTGFSKAIGFPKLVDGFKGAGEAVGKVGSEAAALGAKFLTMSSIAAFALFAITRSTVDAGDKLSELSSRTQTSVDWFASMRFAAEQADVEQESFNASLDVFTKRLGEAKAGGGELLTFLNKVSPKLAAQVKGAKSTEAAYSLMTDAFARISDAGKLAALGAATFGRNGGPAMANFLHQGSAAIQKQQLEYLHLSGSQQKFADSSSDLDNAMRRSETAFLGLRSAAAGALFPAFTKLSNVVTDFIVKNRDGISAWAERGAAAISAWVDSGGFERLVIGIGDVISSAGSFVEAIGGFKTVAIGAALVITGPLLSAIAMAVPALVSLGVALLTTPIGWFMLGVAAIAGAAFLIYKNWEPIKGFFAKLWGDITYAAEQTWETIKPIWEFIKTAGSPFASSQDGPAGLDPRQNGQWAKRGPLHPSLGAPLGAAAAAQGVVGGSSEARVSVDFTNLPQGARVSKDPTSSAPLDLSAGYSMAAP
jgi:hypothetical protein